MSLYQRRIRRRDSNLERGRQRRFQNPLPNFFSGIGQGDDILDVERGQGLLDTRGEAATCEKFTIGFRRSGKSAGHPYAGTGQLADHLSEGGILAADAFHVGHAQLFKRDDVLRRAHSAVRSESEKSVILPTESFLRTTT